MSIVHEIRRLEQGPMADEEPDGIGTVTLLGLCENDAESVARRASEVLRVVLDFSFPPWPTQAEWCHHLPDWFVSASAPEMSREEAERWLGKWRAMTAEERVELEQTQRWALADWLHWLKPNERQWELWDCGASDKHIVRLTIQVEAWPIAHGALNWLLRAAGADRVMVEEGN
jgi:hypothetical protein